MNDMKNVAISRRALSRKLFSMQTVENLSVARVLAAVFSEVMDERITPRQAVCIVNAFVALMLTVFSFAVPMLFRVICFAWLLVALRQCRREGLGDD
jgi:hypothetical protein